jgi:hypothetical protein
MGWVAIWFVRAMLISSEESQSRRRNRASETFVGRESWHKREIRTNGAGVSLSEHFLQRYEGKWLRFSDILCDRLWDPTSEITLDLHMTKKEGDVKRRLSDLNNKRQLCST